MGFQAQDVALAGNLADTAIPDSLESGVANADVLELGAAHVGTPRERDNYLEEPRTIETKCLLQDWCCFASLAANVDPKHHLSPLSMGMAVSILNKQGCLPVLSTDTQPAGNRPGSGMSCLLMSDSSAWKP